MSDARLLLMCLAAPIWLCAATGCSAISGLGQTTWHHKCGWKAEDYFDDPKVISLCHAIEANDIAEIDRIVALGADVNAKGKGNMTPLLWAYPDNKLPRFARLLEHGADPNIVFESDFNSHGGMQRGDSVTHMACKSSFPGYFEAVFDHGGNPNLLKDGLISKQTPIFTLLKGAAVDKEAKVKLLIEKGANINHMDGGWSTPALLAIGRGGQFGIVLLLLESGADPSVTIPRSNTRVIHNVLEREALKETWTDKQAADYQKLVQWLVEHGESLESARSDMARWKSWSSTTGEYRRKMDAEIAERKAKEASEKAAGNK